MVLIYYDLLMDHNVNLICEAHSLKQIFFMTDMLQVLTLVTHFTRRPMAAQKAWNRINEDKFTALLSCIAVITAHYRELITVLHHAWPLTLTLKYPKDLQPH